MQLEVIENEITRVAEKGKYSFCTKITLKEQAIKQIRELGYNVTSYDNGINWEISWEPTPDYLD